MQVSSFQARCLRSGVSARCDDRLALLSLRVLLSSEGYAISFRTRASRHRSAGMASDGSRSVAEGPSAVFAPCAGSKAGTPFESCPLGIGPPCTGEAGPSGCGQGGFLPCRAGLPPALAASGTGLEASCPWSRSLGSACSRVSSRGTRVVNPATGCKAGAHPHGTAWRLILGQCSSPLFHRAAPTEQPGLARAYRLLGIPGWTLGCRSARARDRAKFFVDGLLTGSLDRAAWSLWGYRFLAPPGPRW